jgi:ATP-binding cassette subfamily B protein
LVGGKDIQTISSKKWRMKCGVVLQDGFIFSDSILKNVTLADENPDLDKFNEAVAVANISDFIWSLPLTYNTKIGDSGVGLSQGQKQRILIARAVYKNPEYILLDEATSALDATNEKVIIGNLNRFFKGRTVIVIAHRLSTVKNADQIIVLAGGEVIERGTHEQLVKSKGTYFQLVENQLELGN